MGKPKKPDDDSNGWFKVSKAIALEQRFLALKPTTKLVYFHLCHLRNDLWKKVVPKMNDQRFYRNDTEIAQELGVSRFTIIRARQALMEKPHPYIDFWFSGNKSWYRILDDVYAKENSKVVDKDALKQDNLVVLKRVESEGVVAEKSQGRWQVCHNINKKRNKAGKYERSPRCEAVPKL